MMIKVAVRGNNSFTLSGSSLDRDDRDSFIALYSRGFEIVLKLNPCPLIRSSELPREEVLVKLRDMLDAYHLSEEIDKEDLNKYLDMIQKFVNEHPDYRGPLKTPEQETIELQIRKVQEVIGNACLKVTTHGTECPNTHRNRTAVIAVIAAFKQMDSETFRRVVMIMSETDLFNGQGLDELRAFERELDEAAGQLDDDWVSGTPVDPYLVTSDWP